MRLKLFSLLALSALFFSFGCVSIGAGGGFPVFNGAQIFNFMFFQWKTAIFAAMLISTFVAVLMYMGASIINHKELLAWSKSEFGQLLATGLIVANVLFFITTINQLTFDSFGSTLGCSQPEDCPIELGQKMLKSIYSDVREMNKNILQLNTWFLIMSGMNLFVESINPPWYSFSFTPFAGTSMISNSLTICFDSLMKIMMLVKAQQYVLKLVQTALFPSFMCIGILCRTFFFTRKLGGLMIAIALGLYFVFPLSYVFAKDAIYSTCLDATGAYDYSKPCVGNWLFKVKQSDIDDLGTYTFQPNSRTGDRIIMQTNQAGLASSMWNWVNGDLLMDTGGLFDRVGRLLVFTTFVPFVSLVLTISFIKVLSPLLGGDVEIAGLTRLI
ncbi:hypothetical protein HY992_00445 [Candidatus Micrarchaeota archaeon]|nr:hypothetical protein [Candidatus Micrarchaeota archaeon]